MMPVNMLVGYGSIRQFSRAHRPRMPKLLFGGLEDRQHVFADHFHRHSLEPRSVSQRLEGEAGDRRDAVTTDQQGRMHPGETVDEAGTEEGGGELRTTFDKEAGDAALAERPERQGEVDVP